MTINRKPLLSRRAAVLLAALVATAVGCGSGNYSNDDIDFQLAVPEREDLAANLTTQQTMVVGDPAEYLKTTREAVTSFNALIDGLVSIVDRVRVLTPSERHGDVRVWGPFPQEDDRRWEVRMQMTRGSDARSLTGHSFVYAIEYHLVGSGPTSWAPFMTGTLIPGDGLRRGTGDITLAVATARAAGFPVKGFDNLDNLVVKYRRAVYPITVDLTYQNVATVDSPGGNYSYSEAADGAGTMTFVWRTRETLLVQAIAITSRWIPGGAGRADVRVVEGLAAAGTGRGIDCWAADGHATYVRRDFDQPRRESGDPATCVLDAPAP
jgi:hypothetical protein